MSVIILASSDAELSCVHLIAEWDILVLAVWKEIHPYEQREAIQSPGLGSGDSDEENITNICIQRRRVYQICMFSLTSYHMSFL